MRILKNIHGYSNEFNITEGTSGFFLKATLEKEHELGNSVSFITRQNLEDVRMCSSP